MAATPTSGLGFQNFFQATLTGDITATSVDIPMDAIPNSAQGFLVIEPDSSTAREVIFYDSKTALKVVCPSAADGRGQDDTTAGAHSTGVTVIGAPVAGYFEALQNMTAVGDDKVLARHVDWASTGADGGIWWEEIGRTTLGVAGDTITVDSLAARKYLRILVSTNATGGTTDQVIRFNNDTGSNYHARFSANNAADSTVSSTVAGLQALTGAFPQFTTIDIVNIATLEKLCVASNVSQNTAGANFPSRRESIFKWSNTASSISRVDIINSAGTGDFAIGSEVVVLGHD